MNLSKIDENAGAPNNPDFKKVVSNLVIQLTITEEKATQIATDIFRVQQTIQDDRKIVLYAPSETFPYTLSFSRESITWMQEKIGSGGEFSVRRSVVFPTTRFSACNLDFSPSKPFCGAIKTAHHKNISVTPKKREVEELFKDGPECAEAVDQFLKTYRDEAGIAISLHRFYPTDLSKFSFKNVNDPLSKMLNVYISISSVYAFINNNGYLHRDIKSANILVEEATCRGIVSDFGHLIRTPKAHHKTSGSPPYLDPYMFGNVKDNLVNQNNREGQQTLEGEVFALGRTLSETLLKYLSELSQELEKKEGYRLSDLVDKIHYKRSKHDFSEFTPQMLNSKLQEIAIQSPYLGNCDTRKDSKTKKFITYIHLFPPLLDRRANFTQACTMLEDLLDREEIDALICLTILACNMQEAPKDRPTMEQIHLQFQSILDTYKERGDFQALKSSLINHPTGVQKRTKVDLNSAFEASLAQTNSLGINEPTCLDEKDKPEQPDSSDI